MAAIDTFAAEIEMNCRFKKKPFRELTRQLFDNPGPDCVCKKRQVPLVFFDDQWPFS